MAPQNPSPKTIRYDPSKTTKKSYSHMILRVIIAVAIVAFIIWQAFQAMGTLMPPTEMGHSQKNKNNNNYATQAGTKMLS